MSILNHSVPSRERNPLAFLRKPKMQNPACTEPAVQSEPIIALASEACFLHALRLERKRAERSGRHFLLMLLEGEEIFGQNAGPKAVSALAAVVTAAIRETDCSGWYRQGWAVGLIFTEVNAAGAQVTEEALRIRMHSALRDRLEPEDLGRIKVSFHWFPETTNGDGWQASEDSVLYPDLRKRGGTRKPALLIKRLLDVAGSVTALLILSPLLALIAAAIKLTSEGPILYRQARIGQYGKWFTFLKFRSMYFNSSAAIHQEYVQGLIRGENGAAADGGQVYKIRDDPRVTPLGRFLRKSSLDELPQFLNVLKGDMSLVGPRPPIPYELEAYDAWHRRRLLEAKPGVTGLWQVSGRSRTTFDEMVRLDLQYARAWSLWLDLRILAQTPRAVFSGKGAY